jgi:aminoglycoside 6'-N-acetyltransferase I
VHRHPDKVTELYIDEVGVAPAYHRQGIARAMLDAMFALGRELGYGEAWVGTEPDNLPARGLYDTRGGTAAEPFVMYVYKL